MQFAGFLETQRHFPRVREAIAEKLDVVQNTFKQKGQNFPPKEIYIRVFKHEQEIELWARAAETDTFLFIKNYPFCSSSGQLGPKRKQGDGQIPEGYYYINRFNPSSNFYLSLGLNYPNSSDRILGKKGSLGGDIFIHGNCVTIGCIPITDDLIKELYLIAVYTKNKGQDKIPVHIFPIKMNGSNLSKIEAFSPENTKFWNNLKGGYSYFEEHHKIPKVTIEQNTGSYLYNR